MSSKVERLAAMTDDKTLISSLLRDNSDRIKLIEFKDARADIWQNFRLVQIDGHTLSYAVCIRCQKPVSYKAREGTGGLHRHPCSKAVAAAALVADLSMPHSPTLAIAPGTSLLSASSSNGHSLGSALGYGKMQSSATNLSLHPSLGRVALPPNYPFNTYPEVRFEQSMSSPERDDDALPMRIVEAAIRELIPWDVTANSLIPLSNDQSQSNVWLSNMQTQPEEHLDQMYQNGVVQVRGDISKLSYVPLTVDCWQNSPVEKYATVWVTLDNRKQVLKTIDISLIDTFEELKIELNKVRLQFCSSLQSYAYIFDNEYQSFAESLSEEYFICPFHELEATISEAFSDEDDDFPVAKAIRKIQRYCNKHSGLDASKTISKYKHAESWHERLKVLKIALEAEEDLKGLIFEESDVSKVFSKDIWPFLAFLDEAFHNLSKSETNLVSATLLQIQLEDKYKSNDADSESLAKLKEKFRAPSAKRGLSTMGLMAVCLHPLFKTLKGLNATVREHTYSKLRQLIKNLEIMEERLKLAIRSSESVNDQDDCASKRIKLNDALSRFKEYMDDTSCSKKDELTKYLDLDETDLSSNMDSRDFWNGDFSMKCPRLALIARQLMATPAVPPSCCFLPDSKTFYIRRKALVQDNLDELLFLNSLLQE